MFDAADPNAVNNLNQSIIHKAVEDDNEEFIAFLMKNGYVTDPNFHYTPTIGIVEEEENNDEDDNEDDEDDNADEIEGSRTDNDDNEMS